MIRIYCPGGWIAGALLFLHGTAAIAQKDSLRQEVEVVKAYTPMLIEVEKINEMPEIKDDPAKKPNFSYSIDSKPVFSALSVKTLEAATIAGQPAEKPGYGLVRAGAGNYNKPYGELFFNNTTSRNSIFGIHAKHLSSHSNLTLAGKDRVKAPFSENEAEIFMKHMYRKSTLSVNLNIDHDGFRYYGYPGADSIPFFLKAPNQSVNYQGAKQTFTRGGININLKNIYASKSDPSAGFDFSYYRFGAKTGQREDFARFNMDFNKPRDRMSLLLNTGAEFSGASSVIYDSIPDETRRQQIWLFFKPAIYIGNETINLKAGFKTWLSTGHKDGTTFVITPDIRFNFAPVKEIINIFAGVNGDYYHNHYSAIAYQNPFVAPTLSVANHKEKYRFFGGFDGKLAPNTNFKIEVDHSTFSDHPFYYLQGFKHPATERLYSDNTFRVLYDDMKTLKFNGEITHNLGDKINFLVNASVYKYTLTEQEKAWNLPLFDANLSLNYSVTERLTVATDIYVIGKREGLLVQLNQAQNPAVTWDIIQRLTSVETRTYVMDTAFDLNFRGNYDLTGKLSLFAQLNNFGFRKYERWLGYPVQSLNFLAGISYSF